jgi:hypothetical protein
MLLEGTDRTSRMRLRPIYVVRRHRSDRQNIFKADVTILSEFLDLAKATQAASRG